MHWPGWWKRSNQLRTSLQWVYKTHSHAACTCRPLQTPFSRGNIGHTPREHSHHTHAVHNLLPSLLRATWWTAMQHVTEEHCLQSQTHCKQFSWHNNGTVAPYSVHPSSCHTTPGEGQESSSFHQGIKCYTRRRITFHLSSFIFLQNLYACAYNFLNCMVSIYFTPFWFTETFHEKPETFPKEFQRPMVNIRKTNKMNNKCIGSSHWRKWFGRFFKKKVASFLGILFIGWPQWSGKEANK